MAPPVGRPLGAGIQPHASRGSMGRAVGGAMSVPKRRGVRAPGGEPPQLEDAVKPSKSPGRPGTKKGTGSAATPGFSPPVVQLVEIVPQWGERGWLIRREGKDAHVVEYGPLSQWRCDCKGWTYRRDCPHVRFIKEEITE